MLFSSKQTPWQCAADPSLRTNALDGIIPCVITMYLYIINIHAFCRLVTYSMGQYVCGAAHIHKKDSSTIRLEATAH